jgi:hypothetical protein
MRRYVLPPGGRLAEATNLCLQDVMAALTWIKRNFAYFGGDPDQVTVYGHSGGAYSTFGLLAAASADGLYRRLPGSPPPHSSPAGLVGRGGRPPIRHGTRRRGQAGRADRPRHGRSGARPPTDC